MHDHDDDIDFTFSDLPSRPGPCKAALAEEVDPVEARLHREREAAPHIAKALNDRPTAGTAEHDQRLADAAVVAEQRLAFDAMCRDIDRVVSRIGELHFERRPLDPAAIMALQDAVTDATTLIANAMKRVK